jgi:energy-coupling factor transport system permease protein
MSRVRALHPVAWWTWALCLAWAAMRTSNVLLLLTIVAVAAFVVSARRSRAVWGGTFRLMVYFGVVTVVTTVFLQVLLGTRLPGHTLFVLPQWDLPSWTSGLSVGGPITGEALLSSLVSGLRLAVLIACFGAANSLAHPGRLLNLVPAALYEVGVAVVVALTFIPHLTESIGRVRNAQRLRGRRLTGLRGMHGLAVPVLQEALDRAISLAASMDSRGYGRLRSVPAAVRRTTNAALLLGLGGALVGSYFVVDPGADHVTGVIALSLGTSVAVGAGILTGRRVRRTRYRTDPWGGPEWFTVGTGAVVVLGYLVGNPSPQQVGMLAWPTLPLVPFAATLIAALPGVVTPAPYQDQRPVPGPGLREVAA